MSSSVRPSVRQHIVRVTQLPAFMNLGWMQRAAVAGSMPGSTRAMPVPPSPGGPLALKLFQDSPANRLHLGSLHRLDADACENVKPAN